MKLTHLTDKSLLADMMGLVQKERALLAQVLWHLKEIDHRKLYSEVKCGSLFEYCVKVLKYSEGQASRRVSACRLLRDMPEISEEIKKGELNLTQLNQAKTFFHEMGLVDSADKKSVINEIKGKTIRETEVILATKRDGNSPSKVTVTLNLETLEELKKLQALKAHTIRDLDSLIMKLVERALKDWDPRVVHKSRKIGKGNSRYVQVGIKAQVWERDQSKCNQCGSRYALQIDHIKPYALGGKTLVENLQLLCRNCNQRKGQGAFGFNYF